MTTQQTIGFIGFGAMASRMAAHLEKAGYATLAYTPSGKGGDGVTHFLPTPAEVANKADIVLACVPDDEALAASMYGPQGVLAGIKADGLLLNTSSVSPEAADALQKAGQEKNICVIDCPVSGSTPEAESANLVILAGGDDAAIARAQPIFDKIGRITIHAGPSGSGARLKLVINGIMGAGLAAVAEGIAYGLAAGLDRSMLFDALDEMAVISPHHKRKIKMAKAGDFSPQFPARLMQKDMRLLMDAAARLAVPAPTLAAVTQQLSLARRAAEDADYSVLIGVMEKIVANDA
ncbi:3-hydroxyisobutyrate dehydrogenase [Acetobacter pasteurianus]|uniref:3-hydroxyisobutyrate dehydrogenase n=1 Tax=Acetobacter pasteurianus NBRC 3188 TaxID=1226663 RepID=A0A401WU81_ACEPA|nr:NAD(P)-dependent oxidoreductase [Acetobacter pasteurianus]QHM92256.1 NAD(P)-dependent oxidoreductase [Acetobacter pasteurianus]RCL09382.1 3-hydroxyisobutyrate dehydrogenase [Acetobacter pasteurianus]GAB30775.1 3-hydroxyisobutyrate dehydrogenase [Acetobacter pasteurianus subsp. pasteurianus LMG 1262 = NBRC 106471]GCD50042.1 3-hydroxyisobutyrate dehydrogenase [Acetobacter pasteurianus subsp. pasteurianus LMG 1262 = NBRC 106471]GCD52908.1 3-hydroxyisobutyrate dehydrogenase [Acetobacter pasteur